MTTSDNKQNANNEYTFHTYIRRGKDLPSFIAPVKNYKKRECYAKLTAFLFEEAQDRVFIIYGLRRTGKTTMIRQALLDMSEEQLQQAAFLQIKPHNTLSDVNQDLQYLESHGYKYIFLDEVTLMEDFIEGAALFADIYASSGMKIVLSGTDSLGFIFSKDDQLYDRCLCLHTTFIHYREFANVLNINGIDEYIRYGGTMSMSGINYNEAPTFADEKTTEEYIDTAIAHNIQHSLEHYQNGTHFRHLYDLFAHNELTSAINRVVEDINHRFTVEVLTKNFKSNDLAISARNLLHDRIAPTDLKTTINYSEITNNLKELLEILNKHEQKVQINETHTYQIKEYLTLLDLLKEVDLKHLPNISTTDKITIITQPGLRYAQAKALVDSLLADTKFAELSLIERTRILERILSEIKGRMMEDIVLLETKLAYPKKQVFQLQFAVGEFDMVIFDNTSLSCEIYEIKYSNEIIPNQYRHLIDAEKCSATEHHFGRITKKCVIYRGESTMIEDIHYMNVEEYLEGLV